MAHHTLRSAYEPLVARLNRLPQGAHPSDTLYAILQLLFTPKEAGLVALLPIRPFTAQHAAKVWKMKLAEAQNILDALAATDTTTPSGQFTFDDHGQAVRTIFLTEVVEGDGGPAQQIIEAVEGVDQNWTPAA